MATLKDFIFSKLPERFKEEDTYKDGNGEGLCERTLRELDVTLDDITIPHLEEIVDLKDPLLLSGLVSDNREAFLTILAQDMGSPPDVSSDLSQYKNLVKYIMMIINRKGTLVGYQYFFFLLGYSVTITEEDPADSRYDLSHYDSGELYDSACPVCSNYSIEIADLDPLSPALPSTELLAKYASAVEEFLQPSHAILSEITYAEPAHESFMTLGASPFTGSITIGGTPGDTVLVSWGDGSALEEITLASKEATFTHAYTIPDFTMKIYGNLDSVTWLKVSTKAYQVDLVYMSNLVNLDLSNNQLISMDATVASSSIVTLDISGNLLSSIEINIYPTLEYIDFSSNPLAGFLATPYPPALSTVLADDTLMVYSQVDALYGELFGIAVAGGIYNGRASTTGTTEQATSSSQIPRDFLVNTYNWNISIV